MHAGRLQRLTRHPGVGEKAFMLDGMPAGRPVEAAFEIREHDVGGPKLFPDEDKGHRRIADIHQIHVTGENHLRRHIRSCLDPPSWPFDIARLLANLQADKMRAAEGGDGDGADGAITSGDLPGAP